MPSIHLRPEAHQGLQDGSRPWLRAALAGVVLAGAAAHLSFSPSTRIHRGARLCRVRLGTACQRSVAGADPDRCGTWLPGLHRAAHRRWRRWRWRIHFDGNQWAAHRGGRRHGARSGQPHATGDVERPRSWRRATASRWPEPGYWPNPVVGRCLVPLGCCRSGSRWSSSGTGQHRSHNGTPNSLSSGPFRTRTTATCSYGRAECPATRCGRKLRAHRVGAVV